MPCEVEQTIHEHLAGHDLERIAEGYRISDVASTTLRFLPGDVLQDEFHLVSIAEIETEFTLEIYATRG